MVGLHSWHQAGVGSAHTQKHAQKYLLENAYPIYKCDAKIRNRTVDQLVGERSERGCRLFVADLVLKVEPLQSWRIAVAAAVVRVLCRFGDNVSDDTVAGTANGRRSVDRTDGVAGGIHQNDQRQDDKPTTDVMLIR